MAKQVAKSSALQEYLRVLDVGSLRILEEQIIASIMRVADPVKAPVRLARHVSRFLINPRPIYSATVENGRLEYDSSSQRFNILLRAGKGPGSHDDPPTARLRFTYAHEVGHRFCFVHHNGDWKRAIQIVVSKLSGATRVRSLRTLTMLEERLCNDVAARLLMPDMLLTRVVETAASDSGQSSLSDIVLSVSRTFHVTNQCAMVRLEKAVRRGVLHPADGLCVFLLGWRPEHGRLNRKPSVLTSIIPRLLDGSKVRGSFPGADFKTFGGDLERLAYEFLNAREGVIESSITLHVGGGHSQWVPIRKDFSGKWDTITRRGLGDGGSVLVWGRIAQPLTNNSGFFHSTPCNYLGAA